MKYQLYYIPNKARIDPSYMEKTRSILATSPYAISQIPVFSQVPFIIPKYKLGIMKPQPLSFTLTMDSPHEPYINLDELKLILENNILEVKLFLRKERRNQDYDGDQMILIDPQEIGVLSHKQQLDLLNQLLRFKQDILDSLDPSKQTFQVQKQQYSQAISPFSVQTEEKVPQKPQTEAKKDTSSKQPKQKHKHQSYKQHESQHHHRHKSQRDLSKKIDKIQKQLDEIQKQPHYLIIPGQQEPQQQIIYQDTLIEPKKEKNKPIQPKDNVSEQLLREIERKLDQIQANDNDISSIKPENEKKQKEIQDILNKNQQIISRDNIREILQSQQRQNPVSGIQQIEKAIVPEKQIKYKTYLPKFSKEIKKQYEAEIKRQRNHNTDYQSKLFSPALIITKLNKENIFKLITDEILAELIDETIAEFILFVQEVMYKQAV